MGLIAKNKKLMKLFYNSKNSLGKQTYGLIEATKKSLLTINTAKVNVTATQWIEIAEGLGIQVSDLIEKSHVDFKKEYGEDDLVMEDSGWLKILDQHPEFVRRPILLKGTEFHFIEVPSKVVEFIEPDSAALDKPYNM